MKTIINNQRVLVSEELEDLTNFPQCKPLALKRTWVAIGCLGEGVPGYWQAQSSMLNGILEFSLSTFFSVDVVWSASLLC